MKPSSIKSKDLVFPYFLLFLQPVFMASNLIIARGGVEFVPPISLAFWRWITTFLILIPFFYKPILKNFEKIRREFSKLFFLGLFPLGFFWPGWMTRSGLNEKDLLHEPHFIGVDKSGVVSKSILYSQMGHSIRMHCLERSQHGRAREFPALVRSNNQVGQARNPPASARLLYMLRDNAPIFLRLFG